MHVTEQMVVGTNGWWRRTKLSPGMATNYFGRQRANSRRHMLVLWFKDDRPSKSIYRIVVVRGHMDYKGIEST